MFYLHGLFDRGFVMFSCLSSCADLLFISFLQTPPGRRAGQQLDTPTQSFSLLHADKRLSVGRYQVSPVGEQTLCVADGTWDSGEHSSVGFLLPNLDVSHFPVSVL